MIMNNTPNPAIDAQPGWRGTDPDGGTWVRCPHGLPGQWAHFTADGKLVFRSQEEAEAAGLEALQAESAWDLRHEVEAWLLAEARWKLAESQDAVRYWRGLWEAEKDRAAAAPAPLDPGVVSDADRAGDAETFLAHWAGGERVSAEDREDFVAAWTGWHRGADFDRECAERDAKAAIGSYVSALAVERAELTAALADAQEAAPAPLDPGNPEHLRQVADVLDSVGRPETARWIRSEADRLDREAREAEQDAADRKRAEEYARTEAEGEHRALGGWSAMRADIREWHIRLALRVIRDERARASN